jgi:hypothetical protein
VTRFITTLAAAATVTAIAASAFAGVGSETSGGAPIVTTVQNDAAPKLIVDPPLPGLLTRGSVLMPYRLEKLRIFPVVGPEALVLSPRIGNLHATIESLAPLLG